MPMQPLGTDVLANTLNPLRVDVSVGAAGATGADLLYARTAGSEYFPSAFRAYRYRVPVLEVSCTVAVSPVVRASSPSPSSPYDLSFLTSYHAISVFVTSSQLTFADLSNLIEKPSGTLGMVDFIATVIFVCGAASGLTDAPNLSFVHTAIK